MTTADVVIAIPTYRRPELLRRLLASLAPEIEGWGVLVVVGDNDAGPDAPRIVADSGLDAVCIPVESPGIAQVRNALIRTATSLRPTWEHMVMLDDDGFVEPGWFETLMAGVDTHDADVTGGPVLGGLPSDASILARNSIFAGRPRQSSGPASHLVGAQNIVIRRRIVDRIGDPWFPVELGRIGGEDHYFFESVVSHGGTLAWCDEAPVTEPTPAARLTARALLRRAYQSNVISSQTSLRFHPRRDVLIRLVEDTGWALRKTAAGIVLRDSDRLASAALDAAALAGRAVGIARRTPPARAHADRR